MAVWRNVAVRVLMVGLVGYDGLGGAAGRRAFARTFAVLPDMRADVRRWGAGSDVLFIEMEIAATIGGRRVAWPNVDRFLFRDGGAVERAAHFDPAPLYRAFLHNPTGWRQLLRLRAG